MHVVVGHVVAPSSTRTLHIALYEELSMQPQLHYQHIYEVLITIYAVYISESRL